MLDYWNNYVSMFFYLDKYWERTKLDDLGGLLGSMDPNLMIDRKPMDTSLLKDWIEIVGDKDRITLDEGFENMIKFIEQQLSWLHLHELYTHLKQVKEEKGSEWVEWEKCYRSAKG